MKKFPFIAAGAAVAAVLCLSGCTAVDESVVNDSQTVYISPQFTQKKENHALSTLTETEKKLYEKLLEAVNNFEEELVLENVSDEQMKKLFKLLYTQENRIFWLDSRYTYNDSTGTLSLIYRYPREEVDGMRAELEVAAGEILGAIPAEASDYEKIVAIHDAIVLKSEFSRSGTHSNSAYGALVKGYAQCEGYAFAMAYLCSSAGIENYVVTGQNADGDSHAWNKILADGSWYNADCAWDDPILAREGDGYIRHDYLFLSDSEINGISHFIDNSLFEAIPCTATDNNFFRKEQLYCHTASEGIEMVEKLAKQAASERKTEIEIRFSNFTGYAEAASSLFDGGELKKIMEKLNSGFGYKVASAHKTENDDLFIIHISLVYESES